MSAPCLHCLFIKNWDCWDAAARTMVKEAQENGLFLNAKFRECHACKPKNRIPPEPWSGLKQYYAKRGFKQ